MECGPIGPGTCTFLVTGTSGVIQSPNYPAAYDHNSVCTWYIQGEDYSRRILLTVSKAIFLALPGKSSAIIPGEPYHKFTQLPNLTSILPFQFETFNTEGPYDTVAIYVGGLSIESSVGVASLSGHLSGPGLHKYISPNNLMILTFTTDDTINSGDSNLDPYGFNATWSNGLRLFTVLFLKSGF